MYSENIKDKYPAAITTTANWVIWIHENGILSAI